MIDDTVKSILRAARDAKTLEDCLAIRERAYVGLATCSESRDACLVAIRVRAAEILDGYKFDIANEAP